jgi:hypothetical protein
MCVLVRLESRPRKTLCVRRTITPPLLLWHLVVGRWFLSSLLLDCYLVEEALLAVAVVTLLRMVVRFLAAAPSRLFCIVLSADRLRQSSQSIVLDKHRNAIATAYEDEDASA